MKYRHDTKARFTNHDSFCIASVFNE